MSVKENFRHFTVLNGQNQDGWNTNQKRWKKQYTPSLHWVVPEKKQTGGEYGYGYEDMEFPGVSKK